MEVSTDGGATWHALHGTLDRRSTSIPSDGTVTGWGERRWWKAAFPVDSHTGPATLRWRYQSDATYSGRGVYVDDVRVEGPDGPVTNVRWRAHGWSRSPN
jgi:hypothetical protein